MVEASCASRKMMDSSMTSTGAASRPAFMSVARIPGCQVFTAMLCSRTSTATLMVSRSTAALVAAYGPMTPRGLVDPAPEEMVTIRPPP